MCKKHLLEARRHCKDYTYIPKWKKVEQTDEPPPLPKCCIHPQCVNKFQDKLIKPAFASTDELEELIGVHASESNPLLLCVSCYGKLYRQFNPPLTCASCGTIGKTGQKFRHSPNVLLVEQYLQDTEFTDISISPDDWLCSSCYNVHCSIIKTMHSEENGTDEMLAKAIETWEGTTKTHNVSKLTIAVVKSVLFVAKHLLQQKALLLPHVCHVFLEAYGVNIMEDNKSVQLTLEVEESSVQFSSRWLLHQLIFYLNTFMMHKCVHMKFGTILFRKGGDMLVALSWALGSSQSTPQWCESNTEKKHREYPNAEKTLKEASIIVNDLIHNEIKNLQPSINCRTLEINESLKNVNPLLLDFLLSITNTVREREITNTTKHIKRIRLFFILCQLMFCTNPKNPPPIHDFIADTIEVCGGSRRLIQILNRLGCVSSPDTHDRFVTFHATIKRQLQIWDELPSNVFTIASVDNFDMLQSYAAVYCGDQKRSYHGTTVQLVQPNSTSLTSVAQQSLHINPTCSLVTDDYVVSEGDQPVVNRKFAQQRRQYSPGSSLVNLGNLGPKRQRTVEVRHITVQPVSTVQLPEPSTITLEGFKENHQQIIERNILEKKLFLYIIQKYTLHHQKDYFPMNATLSEVRVFLNDYSDCGSQNKSAVYYMELIDENPDCAETMSLVAEDLLAKFKGVQDGFVMLVGDGKSYRHLMNIKNQYSTELNKLLIFPGDWHILKNYQPILIKVYYSAGLRELAKNSGYHGATLKSVEHCSSFKRTHYFLLQAWEALYREMLHVYIVNSGSKITADTSCILLTGIQMSSSPKHVMQRISELIEDNQTNEEFMKFVTQRSETDKTWKFWTQFVFTDCFCYFGLYLAVRSSNWQLRVASLKQMAPMFTAFDREYYARILPHHLSEIQRYPPTIMTHLESGAFTVKLSGQQWRAVALDEAHEMCINKDLKNAVVHPTKSNLQKKLYFSIIELRYIKT